ncbi:hypothetical protein [Ketobacter sp.]|uniref:hypothetical protein n=1 Tax=Ketobacter sp. TaxID=2083498 RepID=UPI000F160F1D|nr:hypothetical protein [Ketobacter sp.]RLT97327.1 MAG: hypothetical protein D9N14_11070 [Ketobacter sp.]
MELLVRARGKLLLTVMVGMIACQSIEAKTKSSAAKDCDKIAQQIETYTKLRRNGGTAKQMDSWHRKRNKLKQRFRAAGCTY